MRIELTDQSELVITLSDDGLDNDNYVDLQMGDKTGTVEIDELLSVAHAFEKKRAIRISRENNYPLIKE
jgi:arginine/ornithine N-succinyltransferase beta subunit